MNNMVKQAELTVYFDGLCKVCSKEMAHYRKLKGSEKIAFVDICAHGFDALSEGLDPFQVHKVMHVRKKDGVVLTRVNAFVEIWSLLPRYHWLAKLAQKKLAFRVLEAGYAGFAAIRPLLPRYSSQVDCSDSPYCATKDA